MSSTQRGERGFYVPMKARTPGQVAASRIIAAYETLRERHPHESRTATATRLGLGLDNVSHTKKRGSIGAELLARVASTVGMTVDRLTDAGLPDAAVVAEISARASSEALVETEEIATTSSSDGYVQPRRYENLDRVLAYWSLKAPQRWSEPTIAAARARQLKAAQDPSIDEWERYLDAVESVVRRFEETGAFGTEVDDEALTPPSAGRRRRR